LWVVELPTPLCPYRSVPFWKQFMAEKCSDCQSLPIVWNFADNDEVVACVAVVCVTCGFSEWKTVWLYVWWGRLLWIQRRVGRTGQVDTQQGTPTHVAG